MCAYACPEGAHVCDMRDTCVALKLWVNCTVYSGGNFYLCGMVTMVNAVV